MNKTDTKNGEKVLRSNKRQRRAKINKVQKQSQISPKTRSI